MISDLSSAQVLHIDGIDALAFAQAQFCNDVSALADGHWQWNAWLSAQGRVRAFFHLLRDREDRLRLLLRGGSAFALRDALSRYVFRSKLELRASEIGLLGCDDATQLPDDVDPPAMAVAETIDGSVIAMPGDRPRWLILTNTSVQPPFASAPVSWQLGDIHAGIVILHDTLQDKFLPGWLGLEQLGAISVRKGCYPGQEIIARLHFKGGSKRSLHVLEFSGVAPMVETTLIDHVTGVNAGTIVNVTATSAAEGFALAILQDTDAQKSLSASDGNATTFRVIE